MGQISRHRRLVYLAALPATNGSISMLPSTSYEMKLNVDTVLMRVFPKGTAPSNAADFTAHISAKVRELFDEVGGLITAMSVGNGEVTVTWKKDDPHSDPLDGIVRLLEKAKFNEAVLLLEFFKSAQPDEQDLLYNLGMAYSDMGEIDRALENLRRLLELSPDHVNA